MDSKTETVSDNDELIARFMGHQYDKKEFGVSRVLFKNLWLPPKYSTSWDWLMPVVEKIANTGCMVQIQIDPGFKDVASCMIAKRTKMISFKGGNLLEVTYKAVVEFIRWYCPECLKDKKHKKIK